MVYDVHMIHLVILTYSWLIVLIKYKNKHEVQSFSIWTFRQLNSFSVKEEMFYTLKYKMAFTQTCGVWVTLLLKSN